jgi:hypothetical protein
MRKVLRVAKWIFLVAAGLFLIVQLYRPARTNPVLDQALALESNTHLDPQVASVLDRSCADCHSNKTRWPWYTNVSPVSWFVVDHVDEGRRELNFSEWGRYNKRLKETRLQAMCELAREGQMPLSSYTPMHKGSKPSPDDVKLLCDWTARERAILASR